MNFKNFLFFAHSFLWVTGVIFIAVYLLPAQSLARCDPFAGQMVSVQGDIQARLSDQNNWQLANLNDLYCSGDVIRVGKCSRASVRLHNQSVIRLDQNTIMVFNGLGPEKKSFLEMIKGAAHFISPIPRMLNVVTPFASASVKGTEFVVIVDEEKMVIIVFQGEVETFNTAGKLDLISGQAAEIFLDQAPAYKLIAKPRDAVQWSLYYPSILPPDFDKDAPIDSTLKQLFSESFHLHKEGHPAAALAVLDQVPIPAREPVFYNYRAGLFLSVGRVVEAQKDTEASLEKDPGNSDAFALKAMILLVNNKKEEALNTAGKALEMDTVSPAAFLAMSYAQQSIFDLEAATSTMEAAVAANPSNALIWARLAELELSVQNHDAAIHAASRAAELNPDLAKTQTVLGFSHLIRIETSQAKSAFEKAIELDQADPLPRLGMGLALIREGRLEQGRQEMELAAALDPNNSLIRSYLGKTYHELKMDRKSEAQLQDAKMLDPMDPTPWLYDAIRKQTGNRPVEALQDLQTSMELNDHRAVYRSKLLLDDDAAARGAGLANIYTELGFEQMALAEAYKSLNIDPSNSAGHRFLADSYAQQPRHQIARVSELLRSQLLQPITITPVQSMLAESNKYVYQGQGPANLSLNEYTSLFDRNRISFQASGFVGGNSTLGDEMVLSGVQNNVAFSLGQFHYETDGTRDNNDQKQDIYNLFFQVRLSEKSSIQAEFRDYELKSGDLILRFDPDNFSPFIRHHDQDRTYRLGFRHAPNANTDLLASIIYKDADLASRITPFETRKVDFETDENGYLAETQHMFRTHRFHLTTGAGYFYIDRKNFFQFSSILPDPPYLVSVSSEDKSDIRHTNFYHYAKLSYPEKFVWTLGASVDFFKGGLKDTNQFNPKLGVMFNPWPSTTIRTAAFRTLKRTLITDQTLEPTEVAGFNQFFDDIDGADIWKYGIGLDQKVSNTLFCGIEYSQRDLDILYKYVSPLGIDETGKATWKEDLIRAYLYWTPHDRVAISAEYQYEKFDRDVKSTSELNIIELDTHRIPVQVSFFHPNGISARLKGTYVYQDGTFVQFIGPDLYPIDDNDQFVVFDASLEYRFPKRFGKISLEGKNIFDQSFKYQEIDRYMPTIYPERQILTRCTINF